MVRFGCALHVAGDDFAARIAAFCASAWASGTMFLRWRRMHGEGRRKVWGLYGLFNGLVVRQLIWRCGVGGVDASLRFELQSL